MNEPIGTADGCLPPMLDGQLHLTFEMAVKITQSVLAKFLSIEVALTLRKRNGHRL